MKKILAIDDQKDNLTTIKAVIKTHITNCEVYTALSGKEGLELALSVQPDVILLDIIMPEMDGFEVCKHLKNNTKTKHIPVVMVTAIKTDAHSRIKGLENGADAFLSKPIEPTEFSAQVKVMLRIKQAEDKLRAENEELEKLVNERTFKLKKEEDKYKALYEKAPLPYQSLNADGIIVEANPAWLNTLGYTKEEVIGKWYGDFLEEKSLKIFEQNFPKLKSCGFVEGIGFRLKHHNGTIIDISLNGRSDYTANGEFIKTYCVFQDVTEQKRAERRLNQYKNIVSNSSDILTLLDTDLKYVIGNEAFTDAFGISLESLADKHITEIVGEYQFESKVKQQLEKCLKGEHVNFQTWIDYPTKGRCYMDITYNPFIVDNKIAGVVVNARDITERHKALEALEASEEQNKSITQTAADAIISINSDGEILLWNNAAAKIFGYNAEEMLHKKLEAIIPLQHKKGHVNGLINLQKGHHDKLIGQTVEITALKRNGKEFPIELSLSRWISKNEVNYTAIIRDISDRKEAEQNLQFEQHLLHSLMDNSPDIIYFKNLKSRFIRINKAHAKLFGLKNTQEAIGKTDFDFFKDEHSKVAYQDEQEIIKTGHSIINKEDKETWLDGKITWSASTKLPLYDKQGNITGTFGISRDITKQKRAENIQKALYNISNSVINSKDLISLFGATHKELKKIIDAENFYVALLDKTNSYINVPYCVDQHDSISTFPVGDTITNYVIKTAKTLLANRDKINELIKNGDVGQFGTPSKIWLGIPLKADGIIIGALVLQSYTNENAFSADDISMLEFVSDQISIAIHRKKYEEEIRNALERAKESDRLKSAFLANMSHEIRTPMNGILGFAEILKEPDLTGEEQQTYINIIEQSGVRMLNIINDIIDVSKIEAGLMDISLTETNINEQLDFISKFFSPEVEKKGLALNVYKSLPEEKGILFTDKEKMYAILTNLVKNAIKYSNQGTINIGYKINNKLKTTQLEFYVQDEGIGIPKNRQTAIFERFIQAEVVDKYARQGAGLGLAISKAYAELLGGKIWVESNDNKELGQTGSTFYFSIPYSTQFEETTATNTNKTMNLHLNNLTILIAEDDPISEMLLTTILKPLCKKIVTASNGTEAIELFRKNKDIDVILMDIQMPEMNGYDATKNIRTFDKEVIIIAQSAYAISGDEEKSLEAGCNDYISKPINKDKLLSKIETQIKKKKLN